MNKEDNEKVYCMVERYTVCYQKNKLSHRKIAEQLGIRDWEAYNCHLAMKDLEIIKTNPFSLTEQLGRDKTITDVMKSSGLSCWGIKRVSRGGK